MVELFSGGHFWMIYIVGRFAIMCLELSVHRSECYEIRMSILAYVVLIEREVLMLLLAATH